jgi:hypothetical protein
MISGTNPPGIPTMQSLVLTVRMFIVARVELPDITPVFVAPLEPLEIPPNILN